MAATRSALQHSVFQTDDERLLGFVNILSINDKRKKKETFLCVTGFNFKLFIIIFYFILSFYSTANCCQNLFYKGQRRWISKEG
jgi:hypothetical protein